MYPGLGCNRANGAEARNSAVPSRSNNSALVLVVPWSTARMQVFFIFLDPHAAAPVLRFRFPLPSSRSVQAEILRCRLAQDTPGRRAASRAPVFIGHNLGNRAAQPAIDEASSAVTMPRVSLAAATTASRSMGLMLDMFRTRASIPRSCSLPAASSARTTITPLASRAMSFPLRSTGALPSSKT